MTSKSRKIDAYKLIFSKICWTVLHNGFWFFFPCKFVRNKSLLFCKTLVIKKLTCLNRPDWNFTKTQGSVIRETGVSQHHEGSTNGPLKNPWAFKHYGTEGSLGALAQPWQVLVCLPGSAVNCAALAPRVQRRQLYRHTQTPAAPGKWLFQISPCCSRKVRYSQGVLTRKFRVRYCISVDVWKVSVNVCLIRNLGRPIWAPPIGHRRLGAVPFGRRTFGRRFELWRKNNEAGNSLNAIER